MKTNLDTSLHEISGQQETRNLTIEANGKAFKELISGIYSDKAYAIARETFANCVDSHVQAGRALKPFDMKVPTLLDPEYMVRDYGVSMTHDMVMTLYSTLFRSTKDDPNSDESNKFVGKFGLGSKSPFSYTDAFQLTAYLNGECRIYDCYFNGGIPQIALFARQETEEPDGIMITFPADPKDCPDFERAIVRACEGLTVKPNFVGKTPRLPSRTILREGKRWKLLDSTATGSAEARQGTVLYPLSKHAIIDFPSELAPLLDMHLHLEFPIGELDVTTSRESLSYDDDTSKNIIRALREIVEEVHAEGVAELKKATTYHQFNVTYWRLQLLYATNIWKLLNLDRETFRGKRPALEYKIRTRDVVYKLPTAEVDTSTLSIKFDHHPRFGDLEFCEITSFIKQAYTPLGRFKAAHGANTDLKISSKAEALYLILEDTNIRPRYTYQRMHTIDSKGEFRRHNAVFYHVRHSGDPTFAIRRLQAYCGRMPIFVIHLKDIPYEAPKFGSSGYYAPDDHKIIVGGGDWGSPTEPAPEEAYWVGLYKGEVEGNSRLTPLRLTEIRKMLIAAGKPNMPVIGIPKTQRTLVSKNPGWVELIPEARQVLQKQIEPKQLTAKFVNKIYEPSKIMKKVVQLRDLFQASIFNPLIIDTSIEEMFTAFDEMSKWLVRDKGENDEVLKYLEYLGFDDEVQRIRNEHFEKASQIVQTVLDAESVVLQEFAMLQYMSIPRFPPLREIVSLDGFRERRKAVLPFLAWFKNTRAIRLRHVA